MIEYQPVAPSSCSKAHFLFFSESLSLLFLSRCVNCRSDWHQMCWWSILPTFKGESTLTACWFCTPVPCLGCLLEFVQTSLIADSLIFSRTFCEEVFPCGTKSWFTAWRLASKGFQCRADHGRAAWLQRIELTLVFAECFLDQCQCLAWFKSTLLKYRWVQAGRFHRKHGTSLCDQCRCAEEAVYWVSRMNLMPEDVKNIMLKRHWSVACPRYVCNMVKMPAWIIGSLTPYSEFGVITSSSLPRQFARVYAPLLACDVHIEELGPWFWDPMASTAMRPESGDLGVFDKTWTCSVIHLVVPDFPCSFI